MSGRLHTLRNLVATALVGAALAACSSSTTNGSGTAPTPSSPSTGRSTSVHGGGFLTDGAAPSGSTASAGSTSAPAASRTPLPVGTPLEFTGSNTGNTYRASVLASDDITDCSQHAYGQKMVSFLAAHPCRGAHRVVATIVLQGRAVVVSIISTSFVSKDPKDPFATSGQFAKLENADCGCGLSDLLRDPGVQGLPHRIPDNEAFLVLSQDSGVTILDAWYLEGQTKGQDFTLVELERDVFLSELASA